MLTFEVIHKAYIHRLGCLLEKPKSESLNRDSSAYCGLDFEGLCIALLCLWKLLFSELYTPENSLGF